MKDIFGKELKVGNWVAWGYANMEGTVDHYCGKILKFDKDFAVIKMDEKYKYHPNEETHEIYCHQLIKISSR